MCACVATFLTTKREKNTIPRLERGYGWVGVRRGKRKMGEIRSRRQIQRGKRTLILFSIFSPLGMNSGERNESPLPPLFLLETCKLFCAVSSSSSNLVSHPKMLSEPFF